MNAFTPEPDTDAQRVAKMVAGMAEVLGAKDVTAARIRGYVEALSDVPIAALQAGIRRAIVGWRYPDMPKPADIRAAVDEALALAPPAPRWEDERDMPFIPGHHCTACNDVGWQTQPDYDARSGKAPWARRCPCYQTNPVLLRQCAPKPPHRYHADEKREKRR